MIRISQLMYLIPYCSTRFFCESEWVQTIQAAIIHYREEDNDVFVFDKILSGTIDEDFRYVQKKLKDAVRSFILRLFSLIGVIQM